MIAPFEKAKISGARKAAILLTVLGEEPAATVFRDLNEEDLQRVADEVANLGTIPVELSIQVFEEYQRMTQAQDYLIQGGYELARRLLIRAFGETEAEGILQRLTKARELKPLEMLQRADPQKLARFLESEHPQTIVLVPRTGRLLPRRSWARAEGAGGCPGVRRLWERRCRHR